MLLSNIFYYRNLVLGAIQARDKENALKYIAIIENKLSDLKHIVEKW